MEVFSNGTKLHARVEGPDGAPWLVLSHGVATGLAMWDGVMPVLAERYRVLRYDTRGHGASAATDGRYTFDLLAGDVIGLMDALGIQTAHFCGLSLGGMTGLGLALDHAARFNSVVVADARAEAAPAYRDAWTQRAADATAKGIETLVEPSVSRWFTESFRAARPDVISRVKTMVRATSVAGYCGCAAALADLDYGHRLADIRLPVLYLVGAEDQGAPPAAMGRMQAATPGARYVEIPNAGHLAAVEQPDAFARAVLEFLSDVDRR
jgi:3-oxoadipate enol-lactonase